MPRQDARSEATAAEAPSGDDQPAGDLLAGSLPPYELDAQVGFLLRQASQRHRAVFAKAMPADLTPRQWAVLAKLSETGPSPQNLLGRRTAMDAATIKGVVDRLVRRGFVEVSVDLRDARRRTITLTGAGAQIVRGATDAAIATTRETLAPLNAEEQATLLALLAKIS